MRVSSSRVVLILSLGLLATVAACPFPLSGEFLSSLFLHPDSSCEEIAQQLSLGSISAVSTPADAGLIYQPVTFRSANGAMLDAWFVPAQDGAGTPIDQPLGIVLMTHGTDGAIACTMPWGALAALNGYHALLFDYQGFGQSGGTANLATLLDDSEAALNWVLADAAPSRQKVHLLGVSLGTGAALGLAALRDRPQIQSVMLDGLFDPQQQLDAAVAQFGWLFPAAGDSAIQAFSWMFEMRASLGQIRAPILMITAELDAITPPSGAEAMRALMPDMVGGSWLFPGLGHVQSLFAKTANYASLAVTFWRNPGQKADPYAYLTDATIVIPSVTAASRSR